MNAQSSSLNNLLPEIFPVVASLLPLHVTPSTLLSLALVNHHISSLVLPLVYSRLILRNESHALKVLQNLLDEPELGKVVREIHMLSDLSLATRNGEHPFDVVRGLEEVIGAGLLPFMHTLGLHLLNGWHYDDEYESIEGFGCLHSGFWKKVRKNCPRLRGLVLRDIADSEENPWLDESGLLEIQDITSFTLNFKGFTLSKEGGEKLLKNIESLSCSLHTLDLAPHSTDFVSASPLFSLDMPHLRSLSLTSFVIENAADAMSFWKRHPRLGYLKLVAGDEKTRWFTSDLPSNFLPNLRHFKANFNDVRVIAHILHQLVSLTVFESVNAQIPYLIRFVLPEGLPNLKSLNIGQSPSASGKNVNIEGSLWYETQDGKFMESKPQKGSRSVLDGYMHSIAHGAPNLEEIGFFSYTIGLSKFANIASEFAGLSKLKRFYHIGNYESLQDLMEEEEERDALVSQAKALAEVCGEITTVVDTSSVNLPYVTTRILRNEEGKIVRVDLGTGYGMQIGNDDEAFPR